MVALVEASPDKKDIVKGTEFYFTMATEYGHLHSSTTTVYYVAKVPNTNTYAIYELNTRKKVTESVVLGGHKHPVSIKYVHECK